MTLLSLGQWTGRRKLPAGVGNAPASSRGSARTHCEDEQCDAEHMAEIIKVQLTPDVALVAHHSGIGTLNFQLDFIEVDAQGRRLEKAVQALTAEQARLLWDMFNATADERKT